MRYIRVCFNKELMDVCARLYFIARAFARLREIECIQYLIKVLNTLVGRVYIFCRINKLNPYH